MSGNYLAVQALGFATGSVLFAMLAILAWRAERNTVEPRYGTRAAALGFLWNLGSLIRYLGLLAGLPGSGLTVRLGSALAWCAIAILPTAVFLLLRRAAWGQTWRATASRYFRRLSCLIAAVLTLGFLLTAWSASMYVDLPVPGSAGPLSITFHTVMHLSAYNLVLHVIAGVVLTPGLPLHAAGKAYSKTVLLWMAGLGVLLMISIHGGLSPGVQSVMETATQQSTIPVAIISLVYLARFRFADVFAKRSLVILAAAVAALAYVRLVVEPASGALRRSESHSGPLIWLMATTLWAGLLLLFPAIERAINIAADRWLFRRPDYAEIIQRFVRDSDTAMDERQLLALTEDVVRAAIGISTNRRPGEIHIVPAAKRERSESPHTGDIVTSDQPGDLPGFSIDHRSLVEIPVHGAGGYVIVAQMGQTGGKLLSEELKFLSLLANHAGHRIDVLGFEREIRERELHEARLRQLVAESELKALRAQLNPHFLFNTLNTILDLVGSQPDKAEAMIERLSDVFRHVTMRTDREMISIGEEIDFLTQYLEIERARFGARLLIRVEVEPALLREPIPSLILQPLVENAIKHGLAPKPGPGTIRINAAAVGDSIRLVVEDDGVGWPGDTASAFTAAGSARGDQVGLRNIRERLQMVYGDGAALTISTSPDVGTSVCISIAKYNAENSDNRRRRLGQIAPAKTSGQLQ